MTSTQQSVGFLEDTKIYLHTTIAKCMHAKAEEIEVILDEMGVPRIRIGRQTWVSGYLFRRYFERHAVSSGQRVK